MTTTPTTTPTTAPTTPDLTNYRTVHHCLRRAAHRLAAAGHQLDPQDHRRVHAFATYWEGYAGEILCHHTIEDDYFFPALAERVAVGAEALVAIDGDHEHLDVLMADITAQVRRVVGGGGTRTLCRLLDELADHLDTHLAVEDADLLPLFERHFTAEEYEELDTRAVKSLGIGKQAAFTIPFIAEGAPPGRWAAMLATAPLPLRILYRLTWRRHARLVDAAFGPDVPVVTPALVGVS